MKKVLILVLSCETPPYDKMVETALNTWDSIDVEGCETVYYFGFSHNHNTDKKIYLPVEEKLMNMGHKTVAALEWAINNKDFDYVARVHSSTYVDKKNLIKYVQELPNENVFAGAIADSQNGFKFCWGGAHYLISRDVVKTIVDNKRTWEHKYMEDESMSLLVSQSGIPFTDGKSGSIDNLGDKWQCISYGGESITFTDFSELKRLKHHYYRVKCDGKRWVDEFLMKELFKTLQ